MAAAPPVRAARGLSLVELGIALAVVALLAGLAWPSFSMPLRKSRRADATVALERLWRAQERQREAQGRYALTLGELHGATVSEGGLYRLELVSFGPDAYDLVAHAQGRQADDVDCPALVLHVQGLISERGPDARCWNL